MLVKFGREISPFKFSGGAREQSFKFCRFLREALLHSVSFEILMFRLFAARLCDQILNLRRLLIADFPCDLNFKFNRKVEILKRQNLDFARYRSAFKFKINFTATQCVTKRRRGE